MLFNRVGQGKPLVREIVSRRWTLEVELDDGVLKGYATCARSAYTYHFAFIEGELVMEPDTVIQVPKMVQSRMKSLMRLEAKKLKKG